MIQDEVLGELKLNKDYDTLESKIQQCEADASLFLGVNAESKPSWIHTRSTAKKLLADRDAWDKTMRELTAENLAELANNWFSQDEGNPRNPETSPITEEELAQRISMTSLSATSGGSFTAQFDRDGIFTDHVVTVCDSLREDLKAASIEGWELSMGKVTAVNTCLDVLEGRNCIYLDQVKQDGLNNLTFTGDISGRLAFQHRDEKDWFPYTLTFRQVLAYFSCGLDTYRSMAGTEYIVSSSFDLTEDSTWPESSPVRGDPDKDTYQHCRLFTYNDVYDIIAASYEFMAKL